MVKVTPIRHRPPQAVSEPGEPKHGKLLSLRQKLGRPVDTELRHVRQSAVADLLVFFRGLVGIKNP